MYASHSQVCQVRPYGGCHIMDPPTPEWRPRWDTHPDLVWKWRDSRPRKGWPRDHPDWPENGAPPAPPALYRPTGAAAHIAPPAPSAPPLLDVTSAAGSVVMLDSASTNGSEGAPPTAEVSQECVAVATQRLPRSFRLRPDTRAEPPPQPPCGTALVGAWGVTPGAAAVNKVQLGRLCIEFSWDGHSHGLCSSVTVKQGRPQASAAAAASHTLSVDEQHSILNTYKQRLVSREFTN